MLFKRLFWWKLWLEKFEDLVIWILIIAVVIVIIVGIFEGNYIEGLGIIVVIFLVIIVVFFNEYKVN